MITNEFKCRAVHFIGLENCDGWTLKCYGISQVNQDIDENHLNTVRKFLPEWLKNARLTDLPTYNVGSLILHEGKEGCFAIICWWIDENMLQLFAYLAKRDKPHVFELISDKGIISCVWELEVLWFERNAWVEEVMKKNTNPKAIENYLTKYLTVKI